MVRGRPVSKRCSQSKATGAFRRRKTELAGLAKARDTTCALHQD